MHPVQVLITMIVFASSIWMCVDANSLDYDRKKMSGLAATSPVGWMLGGILLWIVVFPLYLVNRPKFVAASRKPKPAKPGSSTAGPADASVPSASSSMVDIADTLKQLNELREQGILTDEEFASQKAKLIG